MEPLVIETKTDEKASYDFFRSMTKKGSVSTVFAAAGLILLMIVAGIITYIKQGYVEQICGLGILMPLMVLIGQLTVPSRQKKAAKRNWEREGDDNNRLTFFEDHFDNDYVNKLSSGHVEYSYASLEKVIEEKEYVYVFIGKGRAFIIRREDINEEQLKALRAKLHSLVPEYMYEIKS